jgi:hypothetical protein
MEGEAADHSTVEIKVSVEHRVPFGTLASIAIILVLANWPSWDDLLSWLIQ